MGLLSAVFDLKNSVESRLSNVAALTLVRDAPDPLKVLAVTVAAKVAFPVGPIIKAVVSFDDELETLKYIL